LQTRKVIKTVRCNVLLEEACELVSSNEKVDSYISKQKSPQKEVCQKLRELIHKTLPEIKEEMKWGVPTFGGGKFYIVALKDHVNFGFLVEGSFAGRNRVFGWRRQNHEVH
jgi:hypothetical protein